MGDSSGDRPVRVAAAWLLGRAVVVVAVLLVARLGGLGPERHPLADGNWVLDRFAFWDSYHFTRIADRGYLPPDLPCCDQAYFPGYPGLLAALRPVTGGSLVGAGLLLGLVASTVAAVLLHRLAEQERPGAGRWAVALLALAPATVFLSAVYTEAVFLALALGAWLAAGHRRWWVAGLLAALATSVRVNGLFLLLGLAVTYLLQLHADGRLRRPRVDVLALALPVVPVVAFTTYLHARTGSWNAWREAEATGWGRHTDWPWTGIASAVQSALDAPSTHLALSRWLDVVVVLAALVGLVVLLRQRRWAESAYLAPALGVILCSSLWVSAPRYALTWFPLLLLLARAAADRHRRAVAAYAVVSGLVMAAVTVGFSLRLWVA